MYRKKLVCNLAIEIKRNANINMAFRDDKNENKIKQFL